MPRRTEVNLVKAITRDSRSKDKLENPIHLAAAFACAVTAPSSNHVDWVARNGEESLFQAINRVLPEVSFSLTAITYYGIVETHTN